MGLQYGRFLTPALQAELDALGKKFGYSAGHFHVAFYLAQAFAGKVHKTRLREGLQYLIENPTMDEVRLDSWMSGELESAEGARRHQSFRIKRLKALNFGPFPELEIEFSADEAKPLTLIGAANGRGKTTIFRALHAALYGLDEPTVAGRSPLYNDGASGSTLRLDLTLEDGDGVEVEISREYQYQLGRGTPSCSYGGSAHMRRLNQTLREVEMEEEIEQFLPKTLSGYFFFDAEDKIKQFLNDQQGALKEGIARILGIERLRQLEEQIDILRNQLGRERTKINKAQGGSSQQEIQRELVAIDSQSETLRGHREALAKDIRQRDEDLRTAKEVMDNLLLEFDPERHRLYDEVTKDLGGKQERLQMTGEEIDRLAREFLPLLLVTEELQTIHEQAQAVQLTRRDTAIPEVVSDLHERARQVFDRYSYDPRHLDQIFSQYRDQLSSAGSTGGDELEFTQQQIRAMETLLQQAKEGARLSAALAERERLHEEVARLESKQRGLIPPKTDLAARHAKEMAIQDRLTKELAELRARDSKLETELTDLAKKSQDLRKKSEDVEGYVDDLQRVDAQFERVEAFLNFTKEAGSALRSSKVDLLEEKATEAFQQLTNKQDIRHRIKIGSDDFAAVLVDEQGSKVLFQRSAGEQQVLAMALIAGLARTAEREVPMIIDTPFGRLDGLHRGNICREFFPSVAPQIILLSTDKEIEGHEYDLLKPYIGQEYVIERHPSGQEHSYIRRGYFQ